MLRIVLLADAIFEMICAIFCFVVAMSFAFLYWDSQQTLFNILGFAFLGAALLLAWLAFRPNRALIKIIIVLNAIGGMAAFIVALFVGLSPFTNALIVAAAGIVLLALAIRESVALRRERAAPLVN
jgi:hypothetical protein